MEWLISLALLVAVAAWVVATYHRLNHLRTQVQEAWQQWERSTRHRNSCLSSFAPILALCAPASLALPHELREAVEGSDERLDDKVPQATADGAGSDALPRRDFLQPLGEREKELRVLVGDSLRLIDELPLPGADEELPLLVSRLSASLFQQEQHTRLYNRAVEDYNRALATPSGKLVASAFRLQPASGLRVG